MLKVLIGSARLAAEHHVSLGHEERPVEQFVHGRRRLVEREQHNAPCLCHLRDKKEEAQSCLRG